MSGGSVIFDLDGVLIESEEPWFETRREYAATFGLSWSEADQLAIIGKNSREWSAYMHEVTGIPRSFEQIFDDMVALVVQRFQEKSPLMEGAETVVGELGRIYTLAIASSAPRVLIDWTLQVFRWDQFFRVAVSADECARGKPSPDVYLAAREKLGADGTPTVAIEDSSSGLLAAKSAGLLVIAVPNPRFPPSKEALEVADCAVRRLGELTPPLIESLLRNADVRA